MFRLRQSGFYYVLFLIQNQIIDNVNPLGRPPVIPQIKLLTALTILGTPESYR